MTKTKSKPKPRPTVRKAPEPARGAGAVTVAYLHQDEVAHSWHTSLLQMLLYDLGGGEGRIARGGWFATNCGTGGIVAGRNLTIAQFLEDDRQAEWLFWIDTDMGFTPDTVERLIEVADPVERPIVGGLCFAQKQTGPDGMSGFRCGARPTVYDWIESAEKGPGFQGRAVYPVNTVTRCGGTGSACILIHRSALERIAAEFGGPVWYDQIPNPVTGTLWSEDLSFCIRANALDIPVFVHTGVRTTHLKHLWLGEADYWPQFVATPATARTAVIVPVMERPQNAAPFMATLRATTGMAEVYAIAHHDDTATIQAWVAAGAQVLTGAGRTFAEKVNLGYEGTDEPWMFLVGDDVRFQPGWLDHAQAAAGDKFDVIGTNDLGNPRVMAGEHATHMLVRRSYVDEQGASWDGPKTVAHEGYRHWFVDDELVTVARQRGVFAMALGSIVEHLHPWFGKGTSDAVYELGQSHREQDAALFQKRATVAGLVAG